MFENLTERFERAFKVLKGHGQITEINVAETLKEVRRALLEADVSFNTAKAFTNKVKERLKTDPDLRDLVGRIVDYLNGKK